MSISINGINLPVGVKQYIGSVEIHDIVINGVNVWHYDSVPPNIIVTSPTANQPQSGYVLTGQITDADSGVTSITVNGNGLSGWDGVNFSYATSLGVGVNTFTISATDGAGNNSTNIIAVTRVNDVNNTSTNWSTHQRAGANPNKIYDDQVYFNGTWYTYALKRWSDAPYDHDKGGYEHTTATAQINTAIPLPKGLSSVAFSGWNTTALRIKDNTTGGYIATGTNSVSAGITNEQALHDLVVEIVGFNSNTSYQYASADCGVSSWTFNFYS